MRFLMKNVLHILVVFFGTGLMISYVARRCDRLPNERSLSA